MALTAAQTRQVTTYENRRPVVEYRANWNDEWSIAKYLTPIRGAWMAAPSRSEMQFRFEYGDIKREDHPAEFLRYGPYALKNNYIRVQMTTPAGRRTLWTGLITDESFDAFGTVDGVTGNQLITARGLETLLDMVVIDKGWIKSGDDIGASGQEIGSIPKFNRLDRYGDSILGNRTASVDSTYGVHMFSSDSAVWSNLDIINHLFRFFQPAGITLGLSGESELLGNITLPHDLDGLTLRECLIRLVDRHRGLGWCVRMAGAEPSIHIFSTFGRPIYVSNTVFFPPNPERFQYVVDTLVDLKRAVVQLHNSQKFDRVIVNGDLAEVALTLSHAEGSLTRGWELSNEYDYMREDIGSQDTSDALLNDEARRADRFLAVYQDHVLNPLWDGYSGDGTKPDLVDRYIAVPKIQDDGTVDASQKVPIFIFGRTLLRNIPFKATDSNEFLAPIAFIPDPENSGKYIQVDQVGDNVDRPTATVRVLDDQMGVRIRSKINHIFGKNWFDIGVPPSPPAPSYASNHSVVYDYTDLFITAMIQLDQRVRVVRQISGTPGEALKTLYIQVDGAKLQYIVPTTTYKINQGDLVTHAGGTIRNDNGRLNLIAGLAAAWYAIPRSSIELTYSGLIQGGNVGEYIESISSGWQVQNVGTPVTGIAWDFSAANPTTKIKTGYWELDAARVFDMPGHHTPRQIARDIRQVSREVQTLKERTQRLPDREPPVQTASTSSGTALFPPHSHNGYYDGGWAFGYSGGF